MLNLKNTVFALSLASLVAAPIAAQEVPEPTANEAAENTARDASTQVAEDALAALTETGNAIKALEDGDNEAATAALERAIGKLEVTLAANPDMQLVPVDLSSTVLDVAATPDEIYAAKREAKRLLDNNQLQQARPIIQKLASEVDVTVTYIPLATYPLALKSAAALIKNDQTDEATLVLANALSTLVAVTTVEPLPMLRANALIDEAATLSEKADRSDEENTRLATLLDLIDTEIAVGEALEYGGEGAFEPLKAEMDTIREETGNGGSGTGFFAKLKGLFGGFGSGN
jgi:hypothetical protein